MVNGCNALCLDTRLLCRELQLGHSIEVHCTVHNVELRKTFIAWCQTQPSESLLTRSKRWEKVGTCTFAS